ncbi:MAG: NAD-dependent epimerase/dehydratase family protein [Deltaproteobacteria bacterium]|nr:NAD-dependent epimerase/dehydratase family protein [Deltaproteobacteria bacterium]
MSDRPLSLVTGAAGFTGTHMVETLVRAGHRVRATDHPDALMRDDRLRGRFPSVIRGAGAEIIPADLTHLEGLRELLTDVDFVFHVAGLFSYSAPWETLYKINVEATRNLCEAIIAHRKSARVVVWGAGGIYATKPPGLLLEEPIDETGKQAPANRYLRSKWHQEQLVLDMHRYLGLQVSLIRPFTVYGPRGVYGGAQMIFQFAKTRRPRIPKNFTSRIPFSHVIDVCEAARYIAERNDTIGEAYNVVDDSSYSLAEIIRIISGTHGYRAYWVMPIPMWLVRQCAYVAGFCMRQICRITKQRPAIETQAVKLLGIDLWFSNEKLKSIGYVFRYPDVKIGLQETVKWYEQAGWL